MTRHYLDPSFIVCLYVDQRTTESATRWLQATARTFVISDFAAAEVSSALSRLHRKGLLDLAEAQGVISRFDGWRATSATLRLTSPGDIAACERLVRRFELKLQAPDALHIAMVLADGATLVTFDTRQADAMRQLGDCVVPA